MWSYSTMNFSYIFISIVVPLIKSHAHTFTLTIIPYIIWAYLQFI